MTTGKIVALIIWTFVGKGSIDMYKIICLVYGHTSMKYNLRKNSVAKKKKNFAREHYIIPILGKQNTLFCSKETEAQETK